MKSTLAPTVPQGMIRDHILTHRSSMIIAGMGLGKTSSTLLAIEELILTGQVWGCLIVSPLRVTNLTWPNEVDKWDNFKWLRVANLRTKEGQKEWVNKTADIYLINYEQLQQFSKKHLLQKFDLPVDMVVWDEISKAKDPSSKRINAFRPHWEKFKFHVGLTGTPASNSYLDLFAQIRLLDKGKRLGIVYSKFRKEYFESDYMGYKWEPKAGAEEAIQKKISDMTLTLPSEDWLKIPETVYEDHVITLPKEAKEAYTELEKELLLEIKDDEVEAVNAAVLVGKLLQITGGAVYDTEKNWHTIHDAKIKELVKLQKKLAKEKKTLLVIYYFKHEAERILKALPKAERFEEGKLDRWNAGKIPVMIANAQSISHGLNLQGGGHHMAWFSLTYSRELYDQTNARLARTGQTNITYIHRFICGGTVDDAVAEALRNKGNMQSSLMDALKNLERMKTA